MPLPRLAYGSYPRFQFPGWELAWGDDEPTWSPAAVKDETQADKPQAAATDAATPAAVTPAAATATPSPEPAAKGPQAAASPAESKGVQTAKL